MFERQTRGGSVSTKGALLGTFRLIHGDAPDKREAQEFTRLYRESYSKVYGYVRRRMGGDAATEDVVADAYLLAARSFHQFDPSRAQFSTWVIRIAINCMVSHYRKERPVAPLDELPESVITWEDESDSIDDHELVVRLLGVLDERDRQLILLKYRDNLRNVEIADRLGLNPSTVSTVLSRAVAKMREAYERSR